MQVVKTKINGVDVNVMFDSGADRSFVTKTCADKLGLRNMGKKSLTYCCFAEEGTVRKEKLRDIFEMKVNKDTVKLIGMNVICCSMYRSRVPHDILDAFTGIPFEEDYGKGRPVKIDILIGLDNYWALMNNKCVKSTSGLVAQETAFGWMLSGAWYNDRSRSEQNHDQSMNNASKTRSLFCQTEMAVSETEIRRMWDLDSIGIGPEESEDDKMLDNFNKEIKWNGERYTVKLPWNNIEEKELIVFADASEKAYGCCVYLKTTTDKCSTVSLVMSKVKIAPLKRITLPRLELLAALLGARLVRFISSALELDLIDVAVSLTHLRR